MIDRHAFRPCLIEATLEERVLPAYLPLSQFSSVLSGVRTVTGPYATAAASLGNTNIFGNVSSMGSSSSGGSVSFSTIGVRYSTNGGLGLNFVNRSNSLYSLNAGLGVGYGYSSSITSGGGQSLALAPNPLAYGVSLGASAGLVGRAGLGTATGGERGPSPSGNPGGPPPSQVTPTPSGTTAPATGSGSPVQSNPNLNPPTAPSLNPTSPASGPAGVPTGVNTAGPGMGVPTSAG